jgi:hypothetical protein
VHVPRVHLAQVAEVVRALEAARGVAHGVQVQAFQAGKLFRFFVSFVLF